MHAQVLGAERKGAEKGASSAKFFGVEAVTDRPGGQLQAGNEIAEFTICCVLTGHSAWKVILSTATLSYVRESMCYRGPEQPQVLAITNFAGSLPCAIKRPVATGAENTVDLGVAAAHMQEHALSDDPQVLVRWGLHHLPSCWPIGG